MHEKIRCCWCGWTGEVIDLDLGESDEPKYCPVCGHEEFDNRYFANHVIALFLKPTWNLYQSETREREGAKECG